MKIEKSRGYPVNLHALKNIDLDLWIKNYRPFVKYKEFQNIFNICFEAYLTALRQKKENIFIYDFLLVHHKIVFDLALRSFLFLRLLRLEKNDINYILREKAISVEEEKQNLKKSIFFSDKIFEENYINRLRYIWRRIKLNSHGYGIFKYLNLNSIVNIFASFPFTTTRNTAFILGDKNAREVKGLLEEKNWGTHILQPYLMREKNIDFKQNYLESIKEFLYSFLTNFKAALNTHINVFLNDETILHNYQNFLTCAFLRFLQHKSYLESRNIKGNLLVTACSSLTHRLFFSNWRHINGKVYTFSHGNNFFNAYKPFPLYMMNNLVLSDYFVTGSHGEAEQVKQALEDFNYPIEINTEIIAPKKSVYASLYEVLKTKKNNKFAGKTPRVMVVGCPYGEYHYPPFFPLHYALAFAHLEIRLIKALKRAEYYVIYQAHPESLDKTVGIFDKLTDEFSTEYFENSYVNADCLLFPTHATTTFGYALCTNKPIILLNIKGCSWYQKVFQLLKKRCILLNSRYREEQDVLDFDWKELKEAVKYAVNSKPDYTLVERFAL